MPVIEKRKDGLYWEHAGEQILIQPWGINSLRFRATKKSNFTPNQDWALSYSKDIASKEKANIQIDSNKNTCQITNGKITATINQFGWLKITNDNRTLLEEKWQVKPGGKKTSPLGIPGRELKPIIGGDFKATVRFEAFDNEKFYGMGQRQEKQLNYKGCILELAQRNTQATVPFTLSNRGYGFLWNNPAIGQVIFANNETRWEAKDTDQIDFWITTNDTPSKIIKQYTNATGKTPMLPKYASGFWQCKLRYRTQDELLKVAHEYKNRKLPINVIVIDFFHWPKQGEWKFDPKYWPNPKKMVKELNNMGIKLMVSIWPTVDVNSENYDEMNDKGYLVRSERMYSDSYHFMGNEVFFDATNPGARKFVWNKAKQNYYDNGIRMFWLDEAEPEYGFMYDFDHFRYYQGPALKISNIYPLDYAKTFYEGQKSAGQKDIINLVRCVWAGSQRYGVVLWSGDVHSTFESLRKQVVAGLNAGLSGIAWWTTDIGGFTGGNVHDPKFHELLTRWFQFGTFCPIMRLHGFREPAEQTIEHADRMFNQPFGSGAFNEIYKYPHDTYIILRKYLFMREAIRPYIMEQMKKAHEDGTPIIRPLFYDFNSDNHTWNISNEYMFGPDVLVTPITHAGQRECRVYLPKCNEWIDINSKKHYQGGQTITVDAPIDTIPLFTKASHPLNALLNFKVPEE
ncbi:family 31 glucosidase [Limosilactobacillus reuteri]|uniref:glycoside hydrolase family 31 protein n=1 Tax=Limosilactobacillus reuteri TaxID=1598 RepID=UPI001E5CF21B|nr:TIM-barrel domain-containing protein [Limosilactobacillus reuteri]MCC4435257.1 family 31 glucosidase [Limosilactobacillus reuteri]MCC4437545.1 family 31 glucosidase [Limosilactobacillus reuteri]MCC4441320.1 family 31 glucosidase [Limosilactobacillus reuteri]MCC4443311.1 family 31 glucosidase [Limosilactobacillus reuteri]MCC4445281.1 family 31 glucosidase [Limosilactobacillus reuteri]